MPKETKARGAKAEKAAKPKKDPNAPKRPLSAYMFFSQENRNAIKDENPNASFGDVGKLLGAKWKDMSDAEKKPYNTSAENDKIRYESEKAKYDAK
ncbi:hypothetical protein T439DRAFT_328412 [Meredithblackwellia eburnea MCA 4105]